ncbi:glycosyltransferase family 4 protein, partial [Pluralibacter gergoviae]|nr:glycosyltransferase family 4 protein [Pluralibacter gergoviae]
VDNNSSILKRVYYNLILKRACRNARKIFTVSEFSKKRIIEWSGMDEENIFVLGNGVSEVFNTLAKPHENYRNYVLIVGNRKTHKNEERALESFLTADIDPNIKLIFTGNETESLKAIILKFNASKRVHFTGNVGDKELASLYKSANFLLFPSLYEGFGLPVIEAMACGTAVITSNTTSLVEIAEDGALLVNPRDITEITKAIEFFSNKPESKDKFIDRGIIISKKYSWDKIRKKFDEQMSNL